MKKRLLFVVSGLDSGGVSKSIVTLMNVIDKQRYDVHLLLLSPSRGPFASQLPDDITVHRNEVIEHLLSKFSGVVALLKEGHFLLAIGSCLRMFLSLFNKAYAGWLLAKMMPCAVNDEYDVVVDYAGQHVLYYTIDKLKGKKKITYFHDDYAAWDHYKLMDRKYLPQADYVVVITDYCKDSIIKYFPEIASKVRVIENVVLPDLITAMSKEAVQEEQFFKDNFVLLTVGHVSEKKGFDYALLAAQQLVKWNIDFKWVFIGTYEKKHLDIVKTMGLEDYIFFYGVRQNPYPYFRLADVVVHPARYESQAIVVSEARLLCKPIVVTRFSTVKDILMEGVNASVCEMNGDSLADYLRQIIENKELRQRYIEYLNDHVTSNVDELDKLYSILENRDE